MESKVCTYTEPHQKLQLVAVSVGGLIDYEVRFNRKILKRDDDLNYMRYYFVNCVHSICINRESSLSKLT